MNNILKVSAGLLLLSCALAAGAQGNATGAKKLYCWYEKGLKVCGDALPATAVDSARTELSGKSGLRVGGVDRALSDQERIERQAEQKRLADEAQAADAARRRDIALAESYTSEEELRRAYRIRYELIDESIKSSQLALGNLQQSLLRMLDQAGERELSGKPVPKPMSENIRQHRSSYVQLQADYEQQQRERAAVDEQLEEAVTRYRGMKSSKPEAATAADSQAEGEA